MASNSYKISLKSSLGDCYYGFRGFRGEFYSDLFMIISGGLFLWRVDSLERSTSMLKN